MHSMAMGQESPSWIPRWDSDDHLENPRLAIFLCSDPISCPARIEGRDVPLEAHVFSFLLVSTASVDTVGFKTPLRWLNSLTMPYRQSPAAVNNIAWRRFNHWRGIS